MQRYAVIVDPYTAAVEFVDRFRARDITPVAVFSTAEPLESFHWEPQQGRGFEARYFFDGDLDRLISFVASYEPTCIIAGNEAGVELTDVLVGTLLPARANVPETAPARRDKWQQAQAIRRANVPHVRQFCSNDAAEVERWIVASGLQEASLVLKPTKSAGTDSVYLARPDDDWRPHFDAILGRVNRMGLVNEAVLVMEFVEGPEFMVDTYSVRGVHGLVMVSVYGKHNEGHHLGIYDMGETLAPDDPRTALLFEYTKRVADAIGIRNAAGHAEVIITPDGPRLVEMAARFSGSCMQTHQRVSTGDSQIDRAVRDYAGDDIPFHYEMRQHTRTVWLSARDTGTLVSAQPLEATATLPTVRAAKLPFTGQWIPSTADVFTSIGWMILAGDDPAAIEADYARIRAAEAQLVFTKDPTEALIR